MSLDTIHSAIEERVPVLIERRRDFHRYPELGLQETRTAGIVAEQLRSYGLEVQTGIAQTGVVGLLHGTQPGKTLLLRADMDGLPIQETADHDYVSRNPGVTHACGHDAHMAMLLTVAEVLNRHRDSLKGIIKFVFQPAEEGPGGALPMIEAGVLRDPDVEAALGFHVWNNLPIGQIGVRNGPAMASTDQLEIDILGKGGHGAMPHLSVDAIVIAAQVVSALQSLVSRQVSPLDSVVLTLGTIQGGDRHNIIADRVHLTGTVRTFRRELQREMPEKIERIVGGIARGMGGDYRFTYEPGYPVTVNDPAVADVVRRAAARVVGPDNVVVNEPTMGAEDMAYFLERVPGCFTFIGSANPERGLTNPHHHAAFDFDERALGIGARVIAATVLEYLNPAPST